MNFKSAGFTSQNLATISSKEFFWNIETLYVGDSISTIESIIEFVEGKYFNYKKFNFSIFINDIIECKRSYV